jgi:hypothetical protein
MKSTATAGSTVFLLQLLLGTEHAGGVNRAKPNLIITLDSIERNKPVLSHCLGRN